MMLLSDCFDIVAKNDDLSLSYICLDTDTEKYDFMAKFINVTVGGSCAVIDYKYIK